MNSFPSCYLIPVLDVWEASIFLLDPSPLYRPYIKSSTWHHDFDCLATFLDPNKWCRSCVDRSTKRSKRHILCLRPKKQARLMKEYLHYDRCAELENLTIGGLKPEYYIRKRIFIYFDFYLSSKWLKNNPYSVPSFLVCAFYFSNVFFFTLISIYNLVC